MKLYLVPTPIGNLADITYRAVEVLKNVDCILAEDTRTSMKLLQHYKIDVPLLSHHIHNEHQSIDKLIAHLKSGEIFALVSDAGTPAISDPGFLLARACIQEGISVECLPGPTAFVPALVNSGLPNHSFVFEGFLPPKKGRKTRLKNLVDESRTMIFYESPHKLLKTLNELSALLGGDRQVSVSRELTKVYEETIRGTFIEVIASFNEKSVIKGELVLVVRGK